MRRLAPLAALALAACSASGQYRSPEGAIFDTSGDLAYAPGALNEARLHATNADIITSPGMNVFRRFPRDAAERMVSFYTGALALRPLDPLQLTASQQMILTGVGAMQIKLSAGQGGERLYDLAGGPAGGTGIRFLVLTYPDRALVLERFAATGHEAPQFVLGNDGLWRAMVSDPGGFPILILIRNGARDHSDDGIGIGINVSDLAQSRAFYRDFVGLEELPPMAAPLLGTTLHPFRHGETTILLYQLGDNLHPDNGSAGIQYIVSDAALVAARGADRGVAVETPLNRLAGFDLTTVWLNDPDGVTNYFAQIGPKAR